MNPAGGRSDLNLAQALALLVPAALLAGAWSFQIWGGLFPCEMCWWQRYAHIAALALAMIALLVAWRPGLGRAVLVLAALATLAGGAIGLYHAAGEERYPYIAALALGVIALLVAPRPGLGRAVLALAALAILASGMIGVYHAGVEAGVFKGFTECTRTVTSATSTADLVNQIMNAPAIRCDQVQWRDPVLGISMAGWNAIISTLFALLILWLTFRRPRAQT